MILPPEGCDLNFPSVINLREHLRRAGFPHIPEMTGAKHSTKEFGAWATEAGTYDPSAETRCKSGGMFNTAFSLPGILAFDGDIDGAEASAGCRAAIERVARAKCQFVRTRAGSHRFAKLFRCDRPAAVYSGLQGSEGGIELLTGLGCKLTAFGVHTNKRTGVMSRPQWGPRVPGSDNGRYEDLQVLTWDQALEALAECGPWLGEDVALLDRERHDDRAGEPLASDIDEVCRAFSFIPNSGTVPWPVWNRWGMAIYRATDGDDRGLLAWAEWTMAGAGTKHRDWDARWLAYGNCPPTIIGAGSIFFTAQQNGYRRPAMTGKELLAWRERKAQEWRNKTLAPPT